MTGSRSSFNDIAAKLAAAKSGTSRTSSDLEDGDTGSSEESGAAAAVASASAWFGKMGVPIPNIVTDAAKDLTRDVSGVGSNVANMFGVKGSYEQLTGNASMGIANIATMATKAKAAANRAATTVQENAISRERWMYFFGGAALGAFLISLAFMFVPMIVIVPQKFALLYTLGSLCFLGSFAALRGPAPFLRHLVSRERLLFTVTYVTSMIGTLWASLIYRSYLLTIAFSGVQVVALSWFLVSYIPGGKRALSFATSMVWRMTKGCCKCIMGRGSGGGMLPL